MVDLYMRVFENFMFKKIIGEVHLRSEIITKLENEFSTLTKNLENKNQAELQKTLQNQIKIKLDLVDSQMPWHCRNRKCECLLNF
ncbi:MAG: hypothetical protein EPO63_04980 [Candidatus Nitrosotenuis sp.]|nr:MAG: hypothetical protein EPO63_04980 [Candidatus Nitrosotenuis sp.]